MNRVKAIYAMKERREKAEAEAMQKMCQEAANAKSEIYALYSRIKELLNVANACLQCDVNIEEFVTEGINHKLGFVRPWNRTDKNKSHKYTMMGFRMGGYYGCYDFHTNGSDIFDVHESDKTKMEPEISHMHRFVKEFNEFEKSFYEFVDRITAE